MLPQRVRQVLGLIATLLFGVFIFWSIAQYFDWLCRFLGRSSLCNYCGYRCRYGLL